MLRRLEAEAFVLMVKTKTSTVLLLVGAVLGETTGWIEITKLSAKLSRGIAQHNSDEGREEEHRRPSDQERSVIHKLKQS